MPTFRVAATTPEIEKGRVLFAMLLRPLPWWKRGERRIGA